MQRLLQCVFIDFFYAAVLSGYSKLRLRDLGII